MFGHTQSTDTLIKKKIYCEIPNKTMDFDGAWGRGTSMIDGTIYNAIRVTRFIASSRVHRQ